MLNSDILQNASSISTVKAKVELYNGSTLVKVCTCSDVLESFTIDRVGEGKFFGFGVCQKINCNLIDLERALTIEKGFTIKVALGDGAQFIYPYPTFYIDEVTRDENTNTITVTGYDLIKGAELHTIAEIPDAAYTVLELAEKAAEILAIPSVSLQGFTQGAEVFNTYYESGGNFSGTESLRIALNCIAEVTQSIYFINADESLVFKRLDLAGANLITVSKDDYITLRSSTARKLTAICSATELGDNLGADISPYEVTTGEEGATQYVRNNPLWDLREDRFTLIDNAIEAIGGFTITQFNCDWLGNYLLEIGDKIGFEAEDTSIFSSYVLDDVIKYDGTLEEYTQWEYNENDAEDAYNSTTIGDALNNTYAKVDKVASRIDIVAAKADANGEQVSAIQVNLDSITNSVSSIEKDVEIEIDGIKEQVAELEKKSGTYLTEDNFTIKFEQAIQNGDISLTSVTAFDFNAENLTISKEGSELSTQVSTDGMKILREGEVVLTADNTGVQAYNLHATTYLDIGTNSRFQDYGTDRTGCFWVGGN
jgi:hypothetical protein